MRCDENGINIEYTKKYQVFAVWRRNVIFTCSCIKLKSYLNTEMISVASAPTKEIYTVCLVFLILMTMYRKLNTLLEDTNYNLVCCRSFFTDISMENTQKYTMTMRRAVARTLIGGGGGCIFIYSGSAD